MKTGDFAKKYNLTSNGVRFYVEQGLLCPEKKNKQYIFNKNCEIDMEYIIKLKRLGFSLSEICKIFYVKKFCMYTIDKKIYQSFKDIFYDKKVKVLGEIDELQKCIIELDEEAIQIEQNLNIENKNDIGFSLEFLDLFECPTCHEKLVITNAHIEGKSIILGKLICKCGYTADIEDGILKGSQITDKKLDWSSPASIAFEPTSHYINMETKAYNWIKENLKNIQYSNKVIFSSGGYAGNFLCENAYMFGGSNLFIIADRYMDTVMNIRDKLGELNSRFNMLYVCDESFELPLKEKCIDIFLDDYSSSEFIFYDNCYPINKIAKLLANDAYMIGIFNYYKENAKTLKKIKSEYPKADINKFSINAFKYYLKQFNVDIINSEAIGSVKDPGSGDSFEYHIKGDSLYFFNYIGQHKQE